MENEKSLAVGYNFKTVPIWKLVVLSIITFGVYDIIWAYQNWKKLNENGYKNIPLIRAVFIPITCFYLFRCFDEFLENFNTKLPDRRALASGYLLCHLFSRVVFIVGVLTVIFLAVVQNKINKINEQYFPNEQKNNWNIYNTIYVIILLCYLFYMMFS